MGRGRSRLSNRFAERAIRAAEQAAVHAATQATIARASNRRTTWIIVVTVLAAIMAATAPFIVGRVEEQRRSHETFESQVGVEVSIAQRLGESIDSIPMELGPSSQRSPEDIQRLSQDYIEEFRRVDESERQHEIGQDRDDYLADIYLARRAVYARIRRMLVGAVMQSEYSASHAGEPGRHITSNWAFSATNAHMALNEYVRTIQVAADSRDIVISQHLWRVSPTFTGPLLDDAM